MLLLWRNGALLIGALSHTPQTPYPFSWHGLFPQRKRQHGISEIRGYCLGWGMFQLVHPTVALLLIAAAIKKVSKLQFTKKHYSCKQLLWPSFLTFAYLLRNLYGIGILMSNSRVRIILLSIAMNWFCWYASSQM